MSELFSRVFVMFVKYKEPECLLMEESGMQHLQGVDYVFVVEYVFCLFYYFFHQY